MNERPTYTYTKNNIHDRLHSYPKLRSFYLPSATTSYDSSWITEILTRLVDIFHRFKMRMIYRLTKLHAKCIHHVTPDGSRVSRSSQYQKELLISCMHLVVGFIHFQTGTCSPQILFYSQVTKLQFNIH